MTSRYSKTSSRGRFLTERDKQIVESVYEARYLSTSQIRRLHFDSATRAKTRLRILYNNGWLKKREVGQNREDVYFLGVKGKHLIEERLDLDRDYVAKVAGVSGTGATLLYLDHDIAISSLYVDLKFEAKDHGWRIEWRNARQLELRKLGVQPDAYFRVKGASGGKEAFIEFTAVLPSPSEMKRKLEGYQTLWAKLRPIPVLWLTTTKSKLNSLANQAGEGVLLGLYEDKARLLTGTIWRHMGKQTCFLRPKETVLFKAGGRG